jgi:NitT/TauT family transport system permease protein
MTERPPLLARLRAAYERSRLDRHSGSLLRLLAVLLGLALWQLYAASTPDYLFPGLETVFVAFREQLAAGLLPALGRSLLALFTGYLLAAVVGVPLGLAMGLDERLEVMLDPYINAMYVAPVAALVPILVLLGGPSFEVRAFVVFLFAVFEITIDTFEGVAQTPEGLLEVAESFGAGPSFTVRHVVLPHDLPYITAGLRLGMGRAIQGMVVSEVLVQFVNLGAIVREWADAFRLEGVLSVVLLLMVLSIALTRLIQLVQARLLAWSPEVAL